MPDFNFNNHLSFIDSVIIVKELQYLNVFKNALEKFKKINILKNNKYNLILPLKNEVDTIVYCDRRGKTDSIVELLMRLFKPIQNGDFEIPFKEKDYFSIINLNNGSKILIRTINNLCNVKKNSYSSYKIENLYELIKSKNNYVTYDYLNIYSNSDNENNAEEVLYKMFENVFLITCFTYERLLKYKNFDILKIENNNIIKINKVSNNLFDNDNNVLNTFDDINTSKTVKHSNHSSLDVKDRITIFDTLLKNIKNISDTNNYINLTLNGLIENVTYNVFESDNPNNKKKIHDILFEKLSKLTTIIIILQPNSLCDLKYLLFNINDEFNLPKKNTKDNTNIKENKYNAQHILNHISDFFYSYDNSTSDNNGSYNINDLVNEYVKYFEGDSELALKCLWFVMLSYHIELCINEVHEVYSNINTDTIKTYIKIFGIKQYSKGDFYKMRIEWIFNLFNENNNYSHMLPNIFKYCYWIIMNDDKNNFIFNLYNDNKLQDLSDASD